MLWLWRRPAATALISPLAWKPPYAVGVALKRPKKKKKKCSLGAGFCFLKNILSSSGTKPSKVEGGMVVLTLLTSKN